MADTDKSIYNLRYNQLTSNLEGFGGGSPQWTLLTLNNVDPQQVPVTRLINTTGPLQGGGNLTVDRTLFITQATSTTDGYLSSTDWNTFNNKQPAGNYITALSGDATASGPGSAPFTLATVNGSVGTFTYASLTVNGKGLITSASNGIVGSLTDVGTDGITVTGGTGAVLGAGTSLAQHVADTSHNGYLSSTDWNTFNGKQSTLTFGNLTDIGTDGITVTGGTGAVIGTGTSLSQHVADTTHSGYLSSTDWNTFNGKQASGSYITALTGDVTASGPGSSAATLATVNGNVGSFTNANITVNAKGLITAASNGSGGVTSVSGTTNQINSTGGSTPVLSLSSTLVLPGTFNANGTKLTNIANGTAATDAAAFSQISGQRILQVVQATGAATFNTTSTSFQSTNITAAITPASPSSKVFVYAVWNSQDSPTAGICATIDRAGTNLGDTTGGFIELNNFNGGISSMSILYLDSPASSSSLTYTIKIRSTVSGQIVYAPPPTQNTISPDLGKTVMLLVELG